MLSPFWTKNGVRKEKNKVMCPVDVKGLDESVMYQAIVKREDEPGLFTIISNPFKVVWAVTLTREYGTTGTGLCGQKLERNRNSDFG